jgi:hypothetical protein
MGSEGTVPLTLEFGRRENSVFPRFDHFNSGVYTPAPIEEGAE